MPEKEKTRPCSRTAFTGGKILTLSSICQLAYFLFTSFTGYLINEVVVCQKSIETPVVNCGFFVINIYYFLASEFLMDKNAVVLALMCLCFILYLTGLGCLFTPYNCYFLFIIIISMNPPQKS